MTDNSISSSPKLDHIHHPDGLRAGVCEEYNSILKTNGHESGEGDNTNLTGCNSNGNTFENPPDCTENNLVSVLSEGSFYFSSTPTPNNAHMVSMNSFDSSMQSQTGPSSPIIQPQLNSTVSSQNIISNVLSNGNSECIEISATQHNCSDISNAHLEVSCPATSSVSIYSKPSLDASNVMSERSSSLPNTSLSQNIANWHHENALMSRLPSAERHVSEPMPKEDSSAIEQPMMSSINVSNKFDPTLLSISSNNYLTQVPIPGLNPEEDPLMTIQQSYQQQRPPFINYAPIFSSSLVHPEIEIMISQNQQQPEALNSHQQCVNMPHVHQPADMHPPFRPTYDPRAIKENQNDVMIMSPQHSAASTSLTSNSLIRPEAGIVSSPEHSSGHSNSTPSKQTSFGIIKNFMIKKKPESSSGFARDIVLEGYLHKLTRNGVWQRRFFEVDGVNLTYYKTHKRIKRLATLDLVKVGSISVDDADVDGCTFTIQVSCRLYFLRVEDNATCKDWVINLNRVREARNEIGGLKLITDGNRSGTIEYTSMKVESESGDFSPVVVPILPHRPRFHQCHNPSSSERINPNSSFPTTSLLGERDGPMKVSPTSSVCSAPAAIGNFRFENSEMNYSSPLPTQRPSRQRERSPELFARWQKRRTKLKLMRNRLSSFISWMTMNRRDTKQDNFTISHDISYLNRGTHVPSYADDGATAAETTVFSASTGTTGTNIVPNIDRKSLDTRWLSEEKYNTPTNQFNGKSNINDSSHVNSDPRIIS